MSHPPTIVVVHPKENPLKCTLEPLRGRPDLEFYRFVESGSSPPWRGRHESPRNRHLPPFSARTVAWDRSVCLGLEGPPLSRADAGSSLVILDGTWRQAERMARALGPVPARSLPPARTAYPRISKTYANPDRGLASVEALFLAYFLLGRSTTGLLDHYRWAKEFLRLNASLFGPVGSAGGER